MAQDTSPEKVTDEQAMAAALRRAGWVVAPPKPIHRTLPQKEHYRIQVFPWPTYAAEHGLREIGKVKTKLIDTGVRSLVPPIKMAVLQQLLSSVADLEGEVWEAGVYQGGTALLLHEILHHRMGHDTKLRLFDTFDGMPETDAALDFHRKGDFADTSLDIVKRLLGDDERVILHPGFVPDTFAGLEDSRIKFAHIDLDIHDGVKASMEFVYPRMDRGVIISDDYGISTCPGAKRAIDDFMADKPETPLTLPTGQAAIFKMGRDG
jgi:O-methyltransferase